MMSGGDLQGKADVANPTDFQNAKVYSAISTVVLRDRCGVNLASDIEFLRWKFPYAEVEKVCMF